MTKYNKQKRRSQLNLSYYDQDDFNNTPKNNNLIGVKTNKKKD